MHVNAMCVLGPNKWYDAGDERFNPENILFDARQDNIIAIISKKTGDIVWKVGPYYDDPKYAKLGWIIGQHHAHMIPKGLPGAGNILVFDNGGAAGYGPTNPMSPNGVCRVTRDYSRVLEFNPVTLEIQWQYTPYEAGAVMPMGAHTFYSYYISSAQRLPNGNTLICEGCYGQFIEVTPEHEIVWEYISPYANEKRSLISGDVAISKEQTYEDNGYRGIQHNSVYRAYRVPYEYAPKAPIPNEIPVKPIDISNFRMPNAAPKGGADEVSVVGTVPLENYVGGSNFCINTDEQEAEIAKQLAE